MGSISITGGIVEAFSNFGAGIGTGSFGKNTASSVQKLSPPVSITGGTVHAASTGATGFGTDCAAIGGFGFNEQYNAITLGENMFVFGASGNNGYIATNSYGNYVSIYGESNNNKDVTIKEGYKITFDESAQDVVKRFDADSIYALPGTTVTFTLTDFAKYTSADLIITNDSTGKQIASGKYSECSFTMPEANVTISASEIAYKDYTITCQTAQNGTITAPATAHAGDTVEVTVTPQTNYLVSQMYYSIDSSGEEPVGAVPIEKDESGKYTFTMPKSNIKIVASFIGYVPYFDPTTNKTLECTEYSNVGQNTTWGTGWYYLSENAAFINRIQIEDNAEVNLILGDGKTLNALQGIYVPESASFTVWAQSADESTMGKLTATIAEPESGSAAYDKWEKQSHYWAAIGGGYEQVNTNENISNTDYSDPGKIIIMGGKITADSTGAKILYANDETHDYGMTTGGAAIGGGNGALHKRGTISLKQKSDIIINGGIISAHSGYGAAIGGGAAANSSMPFGTDTNNEITINGGTVTATSENAAAIGTGVYSQSITPVITINGGEIHALSKGTDTAAIGSEKGASVNLKFSVNGGTIYARSDEGAAVGSIDSVWPTDFAIGERMVVENLNGASVPVTTGRNGLMISESEYATNVKIYQAYTVTVDAEITNGKVTADKATAAAGETITLTVNPAEGYMVKSIKQNGTEVEAVNGVYTFTMPAADVVVTAEFENAEEEPYATIRGASSTLDGCIRLNFYIDIPDELKSGSYAVINLDGKETTISINDVQYFVKNQGYKFSINVLAKYVQENVNFKLYNADGTLMKIMNADNTREYTETGIDYTLERYFNNMIKSSDKLEKNLGQAALEYCYSAANRFLDTTHTFTNNITSITSEQFEQFKSVRTGTLPTGVNISGITAMIESDNSIRIYLSFNGVKPSDFIYTVDGETSEIKQNNAGYYYITAPNIAGQDLDKNHTFSISNGSTTYTIKASALTWARSAVNADYEAEIILAKALFFYNQCAKEYFAAQ